MTTVYFCTPQFSHNGHERNQSTSQTNLATSGKTGRIGRAPPGCLRPVPAIPTRPRVPPDVLEDGQLAVRGVGVKKDVHRTAAGCSRELLANAKTWYTCSRETDGNHSRNSSTDEQRSRCSNREATVTRVPRKHQAPPSFSGWRSTAVHRVQSISLVYADRMKTSNARTATKPGLTSLGQQFAARPQRLNSSGRQSPEQAGVPCLDGPNQQRLPPDPTFC